MAFRTALDVAFSGRCRRLDLYGFEEGRPGGDQALRRSYHDKLRTKEKAARQDLHAPLVESWALRWLMRAFPNELRTCVHI